MASAEQSRFNERYQRQLRMLKLAEREKGFSGLVYVPVTAAGTVPILNIPLYLWSDPEQP
jgi:hypothetical protein